MKTTVSDDRQTPNERSRPEPGRLVPLVVFLLALLLALEYHTLVFR